MRILCASMAGAGHAHPMAAVARALAARGHDVVFASGEEHVRDAERAGCSFVPFPRGTGSPVHALRPYADAARFAERFAPAIVALAPDAAVVDLVTIGAALACDLGDVPYATLSIHPLHTPSRELPPFGWGRAPARGPARLGEHWMRRRHRRDLLRARDRLNDARAALGLDPVERLEGHLSPDLILVATLPSLEIPRADWPAEAHVIGPCLWDAEAETPELPRGDEPLVLVCASTAIDHPLVPHALAAVSAVGARAIVTTGKSAFPARVPANVRVSAFARHDALLSHCAAVVCSGGHGIVARALSHGVPLVVVPGAGDQRENGYRVERAGAGIRVLRPTPRAMRRALERVLRERAFAEAARRCSVEARGLDGPARAADLVEALAGATLRPGSPTCG